MHEDTIIPRARYRPTEICLLLLTRHQSYGSRAIGTTMNANVAQCREKDRNHREKEGANEKLMANCDR